MSRATANIAALIDRAIDRFRQGLASGVVETKLTIRNVIEQLDTQLARRARGNRPYTARSQNFPDGVPEADRARLRAELLAVDPRRDLSRPIAGCATSCRHEYLPHAREGVGLVHMRGGDRLYARLVERTRRCR